MNGTRIVSCLCLLGFSISLFMHQTIWEGLALAAFFEFSAQGWERKQANQ